MEKQRRRRASALRDLLQSEASGGLLLMAAGAVALIAANSGLSADYFGVLQMRLGPLSLLHWINDALMALFFLLVGLEIKRELIAGELSTWRLRALPGIGALGGMIVPALIYSAINWGDGLTIRGWAIPAATDIAFALGVLSLLGKRIPASIKLFLMALAIIDDLGAIVIIAIFYTSAISAPMLGAAALTFATLIALNRFGVKILAPYLALGILLWIFVLQSGVHATVAGVLLALTIPLQTNEDAANPDESPLYVLEHALQPWVAYCIMPIFGLANAGVSFAGAGLESFVKPVALGVSAGLFFGKTIGVFLFSFAAIGLKIATKPKGAALSCLFGASILCGVGFTMSLFIGLLAFPDSAELQRQLKLGVLSGSLLSGVVGYAVLFFTMRPNPALKNENRS